MPTDLHEPSPGPAAPEPASFWRRLDNRKLTPQIAILFFLALMVLSALAAGVGYVAHQFRASITRPR